MLSNGKKGMSVFIHYVDKGFAMPYQNQIGVIELTTHSKPKNYLIRISNESVVIPNGNLYSLNSKFYQSFKTINS